MRKRRRDEERAASAAASDVRCASSRIISWNVDGLRALLRSEAGTRALERLLASGPVALCLLEHKLQADSAEARTQLESIAAQHGYSVHWTFSPRAGRDGLVVLVQERAGLLHVSEPTLTSEACTRERRLLTLEFERLWVVFAYAPNSGRPGRLEFRIEQWEPSVRTFLNSLRGKPLLYQGDLNVAHVRALDAWGTTDAQFGGYKASGRTREEADAFDLLLDQCGLVDGFRAFNPRERSATCWAQKKTGAEAQREHWKRYDYALASAQMLRSEHRDAKPGGNELSSVTSSSSSQPALIAVRHLEDAFEGGRPDHLPVASELSGL